jgi:hypothetical protein
MSLASLKLPKGALILNYDKPAQHYYDYELAPRDVLSKLAFLGAISTVEIDGKILPTTAENLQRAGIGRKSLGDGVEMTGLMGCVLLCDGDRFKILDNSLDIVNSQHFTFDEIDITFENSDNDIFQNTLWAKNVEESGRLLAHVKDITSYCKINGQPVLNQHFELPVTEGGIGWLLAAILLKVSINQGKFELSIPEPLLSSPNGAVTIS